MTAPNAVSALPRGDAPRITKVLIASHGGATGAAAIRVGRLVAARWGASAEVVSALTPVAMYPPEVAVNVGELEEAEREGLEALLTRQIAAVPGAAGRTPIHVRIGTPTEVIVEQAHETDASLVILGLGRRELSDRLLGGQTPISVLRRAALPLLAVAADASTLPRVVVVATDFSESATAAAHLALAIAAPNAVVHLVHVRPPASRLARVGGDPATWQRALDEGTMALTTALGDTLTIPPGTVLHETFLRGDPAQSILKFAADVRADLIAVGSHGKTFGQRLVLGSLAEAMLRTAKCSVLVVSARAMGSGYPNATSPARRR